jgi:hyperosmotically inducible periplasmic protein
MFRTLLRVVLVIIIVAAVAAFFIGYRMADRDDRESPSAVGTTGTAVDVSTARDAGAEIAERVAVGANAAQRIASSVALTAKIKSKMALDDTIKASQIDVDSAEGVVRLNGTVDSEAQRDRAVQLARETEGVISVVDELKIR